MAPEYLEEVQHWYVVFQKREKPRFRLIHWLLHDHFVHCLLVREAPGGTTLIIDPMPWGVAVKFVEQDIDSLLLASADQTSAIVSFITDYRRIAGYRPRGIYTCVTLLKSMLGMKSKPFIQTPFALYRYLLKWPQSTVVKPYIPYIREV